MTGLPAHLGQLPVHPLHLHGLSGQVGLRVDSDGLHVVAHARCLLKLFILLNQLLPVVPSLELLETRAHSGLLGLLQHIAVLLLQHLQSDVLQVPPMLSELGLARDATVAVEAG